MRFQPSARSFFSFPMPQKLLFSLLLIVSGCAGALIPLTGSAQRPIAEGYPPLPEGAVLVESSVSSAGGMRPVDLLLAEIERARGELDVDTLPDLVDAEKEVIREMMELESYLRQKANPENFANWMKFLKLDPLIDAIEDGESIRVRGAATVGLASRLRGVEAGLELPPMVSLRESVDRYEVSLRYSDPERGLQGIEIQLDALVDLLSPKVPADKKSTDKKSKDEKTNETDSGESPRQTRSLEELSSADVAEMELLIGRLAGANQAAELVAKIRSYYSESNVHGWVDGRAITDAIMRPVNTPQSVNDCILGTRVIGDSRVDGTVRGQLLPSDGSIRLLVCLDGLFSTSARGYRKPITLDTTGTGNVYAARQLAITERRIVLGETIATADLSTQIQRINHPSKLVRRIAARKAAEQRRQAEAISREKLRSQIYRQFDQQTAEFAQQSFPDLDQTIGPWFRRLDLPALTRTIGSTSDTVYARGMLQRPVGLAAPGPPPALSSIRTASGSGVYPGGYLAAVQVHQSVFDNTIASVLAGETFTTKRIQQIAATLGIELPERALEKKTESGEDSAEENEESDDDFEVDFDRLRPVFVEADGQALRIGIRGTRFRHGDNELDTAMQVSATYRPVSSGDGTMWFVRDEEVELTFPGTSRLTFRQTAIKGNIQRGFEKSFPKELLRRSFPMPSSVAMPTLAGKVLQVSAIDLTDGWITVVVR